MLGDCGANALGALLGLRLALLPSRRARAGLLAAVTALTLAGERVSFTRVIEATPVLRELTGSAAGWRDRRAARDRRAGGTGVAGAAALVAGSPWSAGPPAPAARWCSPTPCPAASAARTRRRTPCRTSLFEVVAGGALAGVVRPCWPGTSPPATPSGPGGPRRRCSAGRCWCWCRWRAGRRTGRAAGRAGARRGRAVPGLGRAGRPDAVVFAPQVVLYGLAVVLTGVLQAHRRFAGPAVAPLLSSVVVAAGYLLYAAAGGGGPAAGLPRGAELALTAGTTLGVAALALTLVPPLLRLRLGLRPSCASPRAPGRRCDGSPSRGCSRWPASSSPPPSRCGWPATGPRPARSWSTPPR